MGALDFGEQQLELVVQSAALGEDRAQQRLVQLGVPRGLDALVIHGLQPPRARASSPDLRFHGANVRDGDLTPEKGGRQVAVLCRPLYPPSRGS
ncbi:hypothetical protein D3C72_2190820 [compost metagenome]